MRKRIWLTGLLLILIILSVFGTSPTKALNMPQIMWVNPDSSAPVGTCITVRVKIDWTDDYGSMHVRFGSEGWQESSEIEFERQFCTGNYAPGTYKIRVEARDENDNSWSHPAVNEVNYTLTAPQQPPTPPKGPNIIVLTLSPSGNATIGDNINIHVKVDSSNPGATKINVPCGGALSHTESPSVEFDSLWPTSGCQPGNATVTVYSRDVNDPNWTNPSVATVSINLNAAPQPVPSPTADFWADTLNITQGQCIYIHWNTSNAVSVDIDGATVNTSGSQQVCPTVTKQYHLSAHAASGGTDANRNLTIAVTAVQLPPQVVSSFQNCDIIKIGYDIFVIKDGQRRHIPNPATLDALGLYQGSVNNHGFSDTQLSTIPIGQDIPDVNINPSGLAAFKAQCFANLPPIVPQPTPVPQTFQPTPTGQSNGDSGTGIDQTEGDVGATGDTTLCSPQCVTLARGVRTDMVIWTPPVAGHLTTPLDILNNADVFQGRAFLWNDQMQEIHIRGPEEDPDANDLVIWPQGCGDTTFGIITFWGGHVGVVTSFRNGHLIIRDANWNNHCDLRFEEVTLLSCMRFITPPHPAEGPQSTAQPNTTETTTNCSQYKWPGNWFCSLINWLKNK